MAKGDIEIKKGNQGKFTAWAKKCTRSFRQTY